MTASAQPRHGVFISYARADGEPAARALHARLAAEVPDVNAWLDRFEIEGGVGWWNQIEQQLDRAEFLVLVMTPAAMRSENTRREWRSARQRGVCIYPVKGVADVELDYALLPRWMRKVHIYDPDAQWQTLVAHLRRGCRATRVPFMAPPLPPDFVERPREASAVLDILLMKGSGESYEPTALAAPIVLRGPGGFGKTTLASAICHNDLIIETFDDGILWVTLGPSPSLLNEMVKIYAALTGDRPGFVDVEDAARELALKLEGRNCLIVIDDVWRLAHLRHFLVGGAGCAYLVTTRMFDLTVDARRIDVERMTPSEALQLMLGGRTVPGVGAEALRALTSRLGDWPLPVKLAGALMRQRLERGEPLTKAIDHLARSMDKRGVVAFDRTDASARSEAVALTLGASLDLLSPDEQRRYYELAVLRADRPIPVATVAMLWHLDEIDTEDLARKLDDFALVDFDLRTGRLRLHDVLREFLTARLPDSAAVHARLVDAWNDLHALPDTYAWRNCAYHLYHAGRVATLHALLLDPAWLTAKLQATDGHSLLDDCALAKDDPLVELVRDALRLSLPGLATDPRQLRAQLHGRLLSSIQPDAVAWRERLPTPAPWLRLLHPTLDTPVGPLRMTLVGHRGEIQALAADSAFRRLFSASEDGTMRVWDLEDGQVLGEFERHGLGVRAVAVADDGRLVLSGGADGKLDLWDAISGKRLDPFTGRPRQAVRAVALSADGHVAACAARGGELQIWDVDSRALLHALVDRDVEVNDVALSADGRRVVSAMEDGTVRVWDAHQGSMQRTLAGHRGSVNAVALSADGRLVLSGSSDRTLRLWDADSGDCLKVLEGHKASVNAVALAADAARAVSGASDHRALCWDLERGRSLLLLEGHSGEVGAVAIDRLGKYAATGSVDRSIRLWRLADTALRAATDAHSGEVKVIVFSPDARLFASGGDDGCVRICEVASARCLRTLDAHAAPVRSLAFTADSACVLSGGLDGRYWMWVIDTGEGIRLPVQHRYTPINYCAMSAAARFLVTACRDQFIYLWEVPAGVQIARYGTRRLFDHLITPSVRRLERPPSDELLDRYLPGETVYDVSLVRVSTRGVFAVFSAMAREPGSVRTAPRPADVDAVPRDAGRACLLMLNLQSGEVRSVNATLADPIGAYAINESGTRLLFALSDNSLKLWDLESDTCAATLHGHSDRVTAVTFAPDDRYMISCSRDRSLRVWSLDPGDALATFTVDASLRSVAVAEDGSCIAAGDASGRVHLFRLDGV